MVDASEQAHNSFQTKWIDYFDKCEDIEKELRFALDKIKSIAGMPWSHPRQNMQWLWDYVLTRLAEVEQNKMTKA